MDKVIQELVEADPRSFNFRYPVDIQEEPVFEDEKFISLRNLYEVMQNTSNSFDGCGEGITAMVQASPH